MIFRRLRLRAPWLISAGLIVIGTTLGASSAQGSGGAVVDDLAKWVLGNVLAIVGGFAVAAKATQAWLKKHVDSAIESHDTSRGAHDIAARHNHDPIYVELRDQRVLLEAIKAQLDAMAGGEERALGKLDSHDNRLQTVEQALAGIKAEHELMHAAALGRRRGDPPGLTVTRLEEPKG